MCQARRNENSPPLPLLGRVALVILTFATAPIAHAGFFPMPMPSGSYNQDVVVENTAPAPVIPGGYTTASMDSGIGNSGTSWYEKGYNSAVPTTGLPPAGSTFTSQTSSTHFYTMAPSYTANNAILLDSSLTNAAFTLIAPAAFTHLSFLESGGHNGVTFNYSVHHQNGNTDTGTASIPDWFSNGTNYAWTANGRVDVGTFAFENVNGNDPQLYSLDITLGNISSPVTSISFAYVSGGGHGAIMAVSGSAGGSFTPIAVTGYNEDIVVEASAGVPGALTGLTTATMDTGITNTETTLYETGYVLASPESGLPYPGSTITNLSAPDHLYTLAPSYTGNNVILLKTNSAPVKVTLNSSSNYSALSFLTAAGNGPVTIGCRVLHANSFSESNSFIVPDWFSEAPVAFAANGRVDVDNKEISSLNEINPCIYAADVALENNSPVSSVTLSWLSGGGDGNAAIFAISGGTSVLPVAEDDFNANSEVAGNIMQQWYNQNGLYNSTGWWNAANCLEALETVAAADNQPQYLEVLSNTFALNAGGDFLDGYYDDEGWWANAWIRGYDLTGNTNFLKMAKTIFADMTNGWSTATCNGGMWWDKSETYKNSIANELFFLTAIRLHQRTPNDTGANNYLYWVQTEWQWFQSVKLINSKGLINDGLSDCVNNGKSTFTYEQGVLIGALVDLYKATGTTSYLTQATTIAHAVISNLTLNDVLVEASPCDPTCGGGDVPEFKGICMRYIAYLYDVTRDPQCYSLLYNSAHAIWFKDRNVFNQLGMSWNGPVDSVDAARQSSALMAVAGLAEPITTNLIFGKGSGDPAFTHAIGSATAPLSWSCGPTNTSAAGYLQSGPHVMYLPTGLHAAHFQIAVDATNSSSASLATLDVLDDNGSTELASKTVPWNSFAQIGVAQDFALLFTNNVGGDPLEFRVFWNNVSGAPDMTVSDVAVDGLINWTGANLTHDIGQLDGLNAWEADTLSASASGYLARGPGTATIPSGDYSVLFELKVDNFNYDNSSVAQLSVIDSDNNTMLASQTLTRSRFPNALYQTFSLNVNLIAQTHYDFRVYWYRAANAPRLTLRSVVLRPGAVPFFTGAQAVNGMALFNLTGSPGQTYSLRATTNLAAPNWTLIQSVTIPANLGFTQVAAPMLGGSAFYQLSSP